MIRANVNKLYDFMKSVFIKLGVPEDEAKICSDVLIASDLSGIESHGIGRLKMYYDRIKLGIQQPVTKIDVISDRKGTAVWDANDGMGHVAGHKAMQKTIDKAKEYGIGAVAVRNSTHYGICGYYAKMAVEQNMIGMTFTNARPSIAPLFGLTPLLGTNPICFGAPTDLEYPFIYDAATSISQRGKIEVLDREQKDTPMGWAIGSDGKPITDTKLLLGELTKGTASMLSLGGDSELFGGHKGYGLAVMVEILCAALQDGEYLKGLIGNKDDKPAPYHLGHFFLAIDISYFINIDRFREISGKIIRELKNDKIREDAERIYIAGEKEYLSEQEIRREGVPVNDALKNNILIMSKELDIPIDFNK